jgi:hypothetical protein
MEKIKSCPDGGHCNNEACIEDLENEIAALKAKNTHVEIYFKRFVVQALMLLVVINIKLLKAGHRVSDYKKIEQPFEQNVNTLSKLCGDLLEHLQEMDNGEPK